jgi:hypothetical protein
MKSKINYLTKSIMILIIIIIAYKLPLFSQHSFCGEFPHHQATSTNPDSIYYDRFGNSYDILSAQQLPSNPEMICDAGYFKLTFSGVDPIYKEVVCQVFKDVSTQFPQRTLTGYCGQTIPNKIVNIKVNYGKDQNNNDLDCNSNILAVGSPLYYNAVGKHGTNCNILNYSQVYHKVNGGNSDFITGDDGLLGLNPCQEKFNFNIESVDPTKYDLYTVVYHEAMHIMGFASQIKIENPYINLNRFYSFYDLLLYKDGQLVQPSEQCGTNCYSLVPWFIDQNCEISVGQNGPKVAYHDNKSDLSHLADSNQGCGNSDFLMNYHLDIGVRKYLQEDELKIMCDIGYSNNGCESDYIIYPQAIPKKKDIESSFSYKYNSLDCLPMLFYACNGEFTLNYSEILKYISSNQSISITDVFLKQDQTSSFSLTNTNTDFTIVRTNSVADNATVYYTVTTDVGCKSINGTIFIYFDLYCQQENCPEPFDPCINMLCMSDFENILGPQFDDTKISISYGFPFWFIGDQFNSPDLFTFPSNTTNQVLRFGNSSGQKAEAFVLKINGGALYDCNLKLKVSSAYIPSTSNGPGIVKIWGSTSPPCNMSDSQVPYGCDIAPFTCQDGSVYNPVCLGEFNVNTTELTVNEIILSASDKDIDINYLIFVSKNIGGSTMIYLDDIILTPLCALDASFTFDGMCPTSFTTAQKNEHITHLWDFGDGISSIHANPNHYFLNKGLYTVTHTIMDQCGNTLTHSETIEINEPCDPGDCVCESPYYIICTTEKNRLSQFTHIPANIFSDCIYIDGDILVDTDWTLDQCRIELAPYSSITIKSGIKLSIINNSEFKSNSHLLSCGNELWDGFIINESGQTGGLTMYNTVVEDANKVFNIRQECNFSVYDNDFINNVNIINTMPLSLFQINTPVGFYGNRMFNNRPLKSFNGHSSEPETAIVLNDIQCFSIGLLGKAQNLIDDFQTGIWNRGSSLYIENTKIENCNYGVNAAWACQEAFHETYFNNNLIGYKSDAGKNDLNRVKFENNRYIAIQNDNMLGLNSLDDISIVQSFDPAYSSTYGIRTNNYSGAWGFNFINNYKIRFDNNVTNSAFGIRIDNATSGMYSIIGNGSSISLPSNIAYTRGMLLTNMDAANISDNNIALGSNYSRSAIGIDIQGGKQMLLKDNTITQLAFQDLTKGINMRISQRNHYCCNHIADLGEGLDFNGNCDQNKLSMTDLNGMMQHGLLMGSSGLIGKQVVQGNRWWETGAANPASFNIAGAEHNSNNYFFTIASQFLVPKLMPPTAPSVIVSAAPDWFRSYNAPELSDCGVCSDIFFRDNPEVVIKYRKIWECLGIDSIITRVDSGNIAISDYEYQLMGGFSGPAEFTEGFNWVANKKLYQKLDANPELLLDRMAMQYYTENSDQEFAQIAVLNNIIGDILYPDRDRKDTLDELECEWIIIKDELVKVNDDILVQDSISLVQIVLKKQLVSDLSRIGNDMKQIFTQFNIERKQNAASLLQVLSSMAFTSERALIEYNVMKTSLEVIMNEQTELSTAQLNRLTGIVERCPLDLGDAVYAARALYRMNYDSNWDDDDLCNIARPRAEKIKNVKDQWQIYPNPTNDDLWIKLPNNKYDNFEINIINHSGQIVKKFEFDSPFNDVIKINSLNLQSGIYLVKIYDKNEILFADKVVIIK